MVFECLRWTGMDHVQLQTSCWDGTETKALPPGQDSHPVTLVKGEWMGAIMKCLNHLIPLDKDGHSVTKGLQLNGIAFCTMSHNPVTLTCKMCCSRACSTQEQHSGEEPRDEAAPSPHRLLLARYSETSHSYCL